jgi:hypothetical protein
MIKLVSAEFVVDYRLRLEFSDRSRGILDFAAFVEAGTVMTEPLREPGFFQRFHLELGVLCWPNGFELSAGALQQRLKEAGLLQGSSAAA